MDVTNRLFGTRPVILHAAGPLDLSPLWPDLAALTYQDTDVLEVTTDRARGAWWRPGGRSASPVG